MRKLPYNFVLLLRFFNMEFMFQSKMILTALLPQRILFCQKHLLYWNSCVYFMEPDRELRIIQYSQKQALKTRTLLYQYSCIYTRGGYNNVCRAAATQLQPATSPQQENKSKGIWQHLIFTTAVFEKVNGQNNLQTLYRFSSYTVYNPLWL